MTTLSTCSGTQPRRRPHLTWDFVVTSRVLTIANPLPFTIRPSGNRYVWWREHPQSVLPGRAMHFDRASVIAPVSIESVATPRFFTLRANRLVVLGDTRPRIGHLPGGR